MSSSNRILSGVVANSANINQGDGSVVGHAGSGHQPSRMPGPGAKPSRNLSNWIIAIATVAVAVLAGLTYLRS